MLSIGVVDAVVNATDGGVDAAGGKAGANTTRAILSRYASYVRNLKYMYVIIGRYNHLYSIHVCKKGNAIVSPTASVIVAIIAESDPRVGVRNCA